MRQIIGIVLLAIFILSPVLAYVVYNLYWFIYCYRHIGDYQYYGERLIAVAWLSLPIIGFLLLLL